MLKYILNSFILIVLLNVFLYGENKEIITIKGYIIDNLCKDFMLKKYKGRGDIKFAKKHKKYCCLLPQCIKSGYSIYSMDGIIYEISDSNNMDVVEFFNKKENTTFVQVEGRVINTKLLVSKIISVEQKRKE